MMKRFAVWAAVLLFLLVMLMTVGSISVFAVDYAGEDAAAVTGDTAKPEIISIEPVQGGLQISWNKVSGIPYYRVYRYYTGKGWTALKDTSLDCYVDANVASGNTYQYRVVGVSAKGSILTGTDTKSVYYAELPVITSAECTANGIRITWSKAAEVSKVAILRQSGGTWTKIAESASTSYVDTTAAYAHSYRYALRAMNADGGYMHSYFDERGAEIKCLVSPEPRVENAFGGVRISWQPVEGADGYRVFYYGSKGWTRLADTAETAFLDTDVESGKNYRYTVRCISADGEQYTSYCDTTGKSIRYIAAPQLTDAESTADGIRLSWTQSSGAAKYRVFYRNSSGGWSRLADTTATSYTDDDVRSGSSYTYTVRCVGADGSYVSSFDSEGIRCTYLTAPVIKEVSSGLGGVDISWDAVPGAEKYRVYYYGRSGWTKLTDTEDTSVQDTDVSSGSTYTYTVRCLSADGSRLTSGYRAGKSAKYIAAPVIKTLRSAEDGVLIGWDRCPGAEKYRVYYYGSRGWTRMADTTANTYLDEDVSSGYSYTYTVRCITNDGSAFMSDCYQGKKLTFYAAPSILGLENTAGGVQISWNKVNGAAQYRLYRSSPSGWQKLTDTASTGYLDDTAVSGETYSYTVRCLNADASAATSDYRAGKSIRYLSQPQIGHIANTTQGVELRWNEVPGAEKYRVYHRVNGGWRKITDTAEALFIHTDAVSGTDYTYTVRCVTSDGRAFASSFDANGASIRYIASPKELTAECEGNSIRISWKASGGAEKYRVYYYGRNGWTKLTDTTSTSVIDDDVASGYTYRYTVRCITASGDFASDYDKDGASCRYTIMPRLHEPDYVKNGVVISWDRCPGADKYRVYYYGRRGWTKLTETTDTAVTDTDVASGHSYRYTVRCIAADGRSFTSDCDTTGVSIYYVSAPVLSNFSTTAARVTLTWTRPNGSSNFRIYKKTSGGWSRLADTADNSYTDYDVSLGSTYTYTVRCVNADGTAFCSGFDPNAFIITVVSSLDDFVYYDQTKYDYPYGDDTICGSGCGPTSFAMIASTLTGRTITPIDAVEWCGNDYYVYNLGTMWSYFKVASDRFGIKMEKQLAPSQFDEVMEALRSGKYVISSQKAGRFTSGGHFIVLAGLDAQGKIVVYDPNGWNKYIGTSFTRDEITESGTQYWIFDYK